MIKETTKYLLLLASITTFSQAERKLETIIEIQSKYESQYVKENGIQYAHTMLKRLKHGIKTANAKAVIKKENESSPVAVIEWHINKKFFLNTINDQLKAYNGEDEKLTKSGRRINRKERSRLYFHLAPLGQHNGMTFEVNSNIHSKYSFLTELYANTKIFIKASTLNSEIYIPIFTSNSKDGCGNDIYDNNKEIICIQTSHPNESELNIGYKQGFKNTLPLTPDETINDITIEVVYYIGNDKF